MGFIKDKSSKNPLADDGTLPQTTAAPIPTTAAPNTGDVTQQIALLLASLTGKAQLDPAQVRAMIKDELAKLPPYAIELRQGEATTVQEGIFHEKYPLLLRLINAGVGNILLSGPAGSGKTTAAEKAAEALGRELFIIPPIGDKFEVTGFVSAAGTYVESMVYKWTKAKPGAILLLDEVDGGFAQALLALNVPLANGIGCFPLEQVKIPREHVVIANGNTWGGGADFDYSGRTKLDAAFTSRFPNKVVWDYDEKFERAISGNADQARFVQGVRKNARKHGVKLIITPRDTLAYTRKRAAGFSHAEALETSFIVQVKPDVREKLLEGVEIPA